MTFYQDKFSTLYKGDCREVLRSLPADLVHCSVFSPPYWGLRKYHDVPDLIWDSKPDCKHEWGKKIESGDNRFRRLETLKIQYERLFNEKDKIAGTNQLKLNSPREV